MICYGADGEGTPWWDWAAISQVAQYPQPSDAYYGERPQFRPSELIAHQTGPECWVLWDVSGAPILQSWNKKPVTARNLAHMRQQVELITGRIVVCIPDTRRIKQYGHPVITFELRRQPY